MLFELQRLRVLGDGAYNILRHPWWDISRDLKLDLDVRVDERDEVLDDLGRKITNSSSSGGRSSSTCADSPLTVRARRELGADASLEHAPTRLLLASSAKALRRINANSLDFAEAL